MITVSAKNGISTSREMAPIVGIHLPTPNERIAAKVANQMNAIPKA